MLLKTPTAGHRRTPTQPAHTTCPMQSAGNVLLGCCSEKQKQRQEQVEFKEEITSRTFQKNVIC